MQNWESMPQAYEHNWFGGVPAIKREVTSQPYNLGQHLLQKSNSMDTYSSQSSPPRTDGLEMHSFYENHIYNGLNNSHHPLGFNPLTPPGYPNAIIPQINFGHNNLQDTVSSPSANAGYKQIDITQSLTPSHTPPMDDTPPKSPKLLLDTPEKDNELSSNSNESGEDTRFVESDNDDDSINKPKFNSHGKVKKYKCKQCEYVAITKVDFWTHGRDHIKPEKLLECHLCPFATELKHHLEYHIRKHKNLKPFRCNKCSYSCVNKSMLNSHLKSHSTVYQYRCANCDYATKYCHSFKLHLRKYTHKPGMVLNEDGTPNPTVIIDIYGTRRGPKMKSSNGREGSNSKSTATKQEPRNSAQPVQSSATPHSRVPPVTSNQQPSSNMMAKLLPNTLASMLQQSGNLNFLPYLNLQMLAVHQQAVLAQLSPNMVADQQSLGKNDDKGNQYDSDSEEFDREPIHHSAMDLSQATPTKTTNCSSLHRKEHSGLEPSPTATPVISTAKIHRRKGRAFKLDAISNSEDDAPSPPPAKSVLSSFDGTRTVKTPESPPTPSNNEAEEAKERRRAVMPTDGDTPEANAKKIAECKYCGIYFRDLAFYSIHMGYHSCDDAFKCNMCGEQCGDPLTFFVHIGRTAHS